MNISIIIPGRKMGSRYHYNSSPCRFFGGMLSFTKLNKITFKNCIYFSVF